VVQPGRHNILFPLSLFSDGLLRKTSVELAAQVVRRGQVIRTCVGTHLERQAAIALVHSARDRGVVFDTYTAWVAYSLGLIGVVKYLFRRVVLPQSSLDELLDWRQRFEGSGDEPLMTIGYAEGEYFREEIPAERLAEAVGTINTGIEALRTELEILPAAAPTAPSVLELTLLDIARHGFLDPVYISMTENLLLLSEDLHYRNLAHQMHGRDGAWLQAALLVAADTRKMELEAYAHAVCDLAIQRHDHVSLNGATLVAIAIEEQSDPIERFKAAAAFIGTPSADVASHLSVGWDFLRAIWATDQPYLRRAKAAGVILERLTSLLARHNQLRPVYSAMIENSRRHPLLRDYLISWARGHFISV